MTRNAAYILFTRLSLSEDEAAITELHNIYFYRLYKLACSIVGDRGAAEEITNDVFVRIWEKRTLLKDVASPELYLLKCARNRALEYLRGQKMDIRLSEDELHDFPLQLEVNPEQLLISSEMVRHINKVIDQLSPKCKLIFLLVKESNLKYREVADLLHISIKTVEAQMSIALKKISQAVPMTFLHH
jgi:RNA polymerase sigma-70 factor (ECF subfamily)